MLLLVFPGANFFTVIYLLAVAFGGLLWGILTIAGAEIIQVIIDIEQNTRTDGKSIPMTDPRDLLRLRDYRIERRTFGWNKIQVTKPDGNEVSLADEPEFIAWARQELKEKFDI